MLFDFDKLFARSAARQMAQHSLEERQRDVYESHRHRVFSVSYYMTGSELEAEDLLRHTFITAFHRADEPDQEAIDASLVEHLQTRIALDPDEYVPVPATVAGSIGRNILRVDLEEAIGCLPPTERLIFLLMDVEGYAAPRIAELLEMSEPDVTRSAWRARIRLRSELAAMQEDGRKAA